MRIASTQPTVIFLHGLNTYGDDDLHLGPLRFGSMHERLERALLDRGVILTPILQIGSSSIEDQANRALEHLKKCALPDRVVMLGHSTGGLVARMLAARTELRERISSILTVGTPHLGVKAVELALDPKLHRRPGHGLSLETMALLGYDARKYGRLETLRQLTPQAMSAFNALLPAGMSQVLLCETTRASTSWPLRILSRQLNPDGEKGDGLVSSASQRAGGPVLGVFELDHLGQIGFFPHLSWPARAIARKEFQRLCDVIAREAKNAQKLEA